MDLSIFNSSNEDGMLKSYGPFRITNADDSFSGIQSPEAVQIGNLEIYGEIEMHGETTILGNKE